MSHEAISNEIFQHFRSEQKKIDNAKKLLKDNGYIVVEAKNKIKGQYI